MTTLERPGLSLATLDELLVSDEIWEETAQDGRLVAEHIMTSSSRIVVLYGPACSITAEFMERWVIPVLREQWHVSFVHCDGTRAPTPDDRPSIEICNRFERFVGDEDEDGRAFLAHLREDEPKARQHRFVLILQDDYLSRLFQLRSVVPGILDDLHEIPSLPPSRFLEALTASCVRRGVLLSDAFAARLTQDLDAVRARAALGPELVAILAFELQRSAIAGSLSAEDYDALGGIVGILKAHVDFLFEHLPDGLDPAIGWAVLCEEARTPAGVAADLVDIGYRFDLHDDAAARVIHWLEKDRRVLRRNTHGGHDVVPSLLGLAVEAMCRRHQEQAEPVRWALRQGVRQYLETGTLLTEGSFRKIDAGRRALIVTSDEAALMARCALHFSVTPLGDPLEHWVRRVRVPTIAAGILLDALFDPQPMVRERAAARLGSFNRPEVRGQLHLVALRDSVSSVRAAAIESLRVVGDDNLRTSLIQEIADPNSPYRLQAIDALRAFANEESVAALVGIVEGNLPGSEGLARARAIEVLGAIDTVRSIEALVTIALDDPDREDRVAAAQALGCLASAQSARRALDTLRSASELLYSWPRLGFSVRKCARGLLWTVLAIGAFVLNLLVHGFMLATIGKRRQAVMLLALEVVLLFLPFPMPIFVWATLIVGSIRPMRILMLERKNGVAQSGYRCAASIVLFVAGCLSAFLVLHGLALLLVREIRRGLTVLSWQAAGLFLIVSTFLFEKLSMYALSSGGSIASLAPVLLIGLGGAILLGTYGKGIGSVALEVFALRRRRVLADRIDQVYRQMLANPMAAAVVADAFASASPRDRRWIQSLVARYRPMLQPALQQLWDQANDILKRRIFRVMTRRPDKLSVKFLGNVAKEMRANARMRWRIAVWDYQLSLWPKPLLLFTPIALLVLVLYTLALREFTMTNPFQLLLAAREGELDGALKAIRTLGQLATSDKPQIAGAASMSLQMALSDPAVKADAERTDHVLRALPQRAGLERLEESVGTLLQEPATPEFTRDLSVEALERIGTPLAAETLRRYAERAFPSSPGAEPRHAPSQRAAIAALARMTGAGDTPLRLLLELQENKALPNALIDDVRLAIARIDPILWSDYSLALSDYGNAILWVHEALYRGTLSATGAANALTNAYTMRGLASLNAGDYVQAAHDLFSALHSDADSAVLNGAVALAQQLGFELHETAALTDPRAYQKAYDVFARALQFRARIESPADITSMEANLAEAALTIGRFDEAHTLASDVARRLADRDVEQDTVLNMKFIAYAALVLAGDNAGAAQEHTALLEYMKKLPADFKNEWVYTGTRRYIESAPHSMRHQLKGTLQIVAGAPDDKN